jgi:hypothetical protein
MRDAGGTPLCSCCGKPRGTYRDGRPRKDRYCAKCRADYESVWRAIKRQEFVAMKQRLRTLEAVVAAPFPQGA